MYKRQDPTLLFQRIYVSEGTAEEFKSYMYYELAPYAMGLFDQGTLRKTDKSKIYGLCQNEKI